MRPASACDGVCTTSVGRSVVSWSSLAGELSVSAAVDDVDDVGVGGVGVVGVAGVDLLPQLAAASARHRTSDVREITG